MLADGSRELHRASDMAKDQSYVLGVLDEKQLAHALFPLGDTVTTKDEIRAEAERRGLAVAKKPDSHDICFIADGDTQGFLASRLGRAEGDIVDESGAKIGSHEGAYGFTIGQRKGLRIGTPAADGKPRYVLDISPVNNTVTVGPAAALDVNALTAIKPRWCGAAPTGPGTYTAQLRAHGGETEVTAELVDGELRVSFVEPVRGVAPRPGDRAVRRHARGGFGDDRGHGAGDGGRGLRPPTATGSRANSARGPWAMVRGCWRGGYGCGLCRGWHAWVPAGRWVGCPGGVGGWVWLWAVSGVARAGVCRVSGGSSGGVGRWVGPWAVSARPARVAAAPGGSSAGAGMCARPRGVSAGHARGRSP